MRGKSGLQTNKVPVEKNSRQGGVNPWTVPQKITAGKFLKGIPVRVKMCGKSARHESAMAHGG